jgi:hypothetical protein
MKINEQIKNEYPWGAEREWEHRTKIIADILPERATVIEMGGGFCHLEKYIKNGEYISLDLKPWTDKTIVADFNKGQFPELLGIYQFIVCQGILEYIEGPEEFLREIKKYGKILIITYRLGQKKEIKERKNRMTFVEIREILEKNGWEILLKSIISISGEQQLFYCKQK